MENSKCKYGMNFISVRRESRLMEFLGYINSLLVNKKYKQYKTNLVCCLQAFASLYVLLVICLECRFRIFQRLVHLLQMRYLVFQFLQLLVKVGILEVQFFIRCWRYKLTGSFSQTLKDSNYRVKVVTSHFSCIQESVNARVFAWRGQKNDSNLSK